jgi:hypothetical protein
MHLDRESICDERLEPMAAIATRIAVFGSGFGSDFGAVVESGREGLVEVRNGNVGVGVEGTLISLSSGTLEGISEVRIMGCEEDGDVGRGERDRLGVLRLRTVHFFFFFFF